MDWMKDIKAIIFDMDGTLYQDYTFMGRYIGRIMEDAFPQAEIEEAIASAYSILEGRGPVKLGYLYDRERNVFYRHDKLEPVSCSDWDGAELDMEEAQGQALTYLGDPWTIAVLVAHRHGVEPDVMRGAFEAVREEMLTETYRIVRNADLFDAIAALEGKRLILMTNSPLPSGQAFVDYLGAMDVFDEIHFDGKKPAGIQGLIDRLLGKGYAPHEILSIGDHPWNDLYPAQQAGGHTCLISGHPHEDDTPWSASVVSIEELAEFLVELSERSNVAGEEEAVR